MRSPQPRIIIVGAGPTGLGAAWRLQELGQTNWRLVERDDRFGGLAKSYVDESGFTWDIAVHVAHSHYHYVDHLMESLLPDGYYCHERRSFIREYGVWIPYPFQYNFRHLPSAAREECLSGLHALRGGQLPPPKNFREWILSSFGEGIARHFMIPYNQKIWSTDVSRMNCHWLGDRVPEVDIARVERNILDKRDDVSWGPNHAFQFPKVGGTGAIWNALGHRLQPEAVALGVSLESLDLDRHTARFSDGTQENYDYLVSTIPLVRLTEMAGQRGLHARTQNLRHTHVQVVGMACDFPMPADLAQRTWIYCPESTEIFYRVTPFSTFSPAHVPHPSRQCSFLCEISTPGEGDVWPKSFLEEKCLHGLRESGLAPVTPENSRFFHIPVEFGYPVPTIDRDDILDDVIGELDRHQVFSRGRFGGWKYEAGNMDHSVMQGVEAANRMVLGEDEVTWRHPHVVNSGKR